MSDSRGGLGQACSSWAPAPGSLHPNVTRWVIPGWYCNSVSALNILTANTLYYQPIFVADSHAYVAISMQINPAVASATARYGMYTWAQGLPGTLRTDFGTVDASVAGNKTITTNIPIVGPDMYFLAYISESAIGVKALDAAQGIWGPVTGIAGTIPGALYQPLLLAANQVGITASGLPTVAPAPTDVAPVTYAALRLQE